MFVSPFVLRMVGSLLFFIIGSYLITYQVFSDKPYIFITSPANAISSVSYAIVDAPLPVKIPLMVLSIASYSLWSNSNTTINFVDVTSIFWVIIAVTIYTLPNARYSLYILLIVDTIFIVSMTVIIYLSADESVLSYYKGNLIVSTGLIYGICSIMMASFYSSSTRFLIGFAIVSFGFICKLLALYQNQYWGTCVFHIMSALGVWILLKLQVSTRSEQLKDNMHNPVAESVAIATYNPMGGLDPVILCNS